MIRILVGRDMPGVKGIAHGPGSSRACERPLAVSCTTCVRCDAPSGSGQVATMSTNSRLRPVGRAARALVRAPGRGAASAARPCTLARRAIGLVETRLLV